MNLTTDHLQTATFAAGCFWGVEETFRNLTGVTSTRVGYIGGDYQNPTYKDVCGDFTGHAEAVEITFDESKVTYEELLEVFWNCHNPTTRNRQGPDIGTQYRSEIFYHSPEQKKLAEKSKSNLESSKKNSNPITTEITEADTFWEAEEYHQQYFAKNGLKGCHI